MTYEQKNTVVSILTNLLVTGYFAFKIFGMYQAGAFGGEDGLMIWARTVLWIIPASIVVTIVLNIVFSVLWSIATNDDKPEMVVDERDRLIGRKGMIGTMIIASAGFIFAMIALAVGWSAFIAFNMVFFSFALSDLGGSLLRLYFYRRGY